MFNQIPLCEITKYLNNSDYLTFRSLCRDTYRNTLQEYSSRTFCLANIAHHINMRYITRRLNNKDYTNLRLTNKYIAEKIKLEINHRMPKYNLYNTIGCTGTCVGSSVGITGTTGTIGTIGAGNLFGIAGYVGSVGFIGNPFLLPIHHNNQYNRRIQKRNNKMQNKKYHQRR